MTQTPTLHGPHAHRVMRRALGSASLIALLSVAAAQAQTAPPTPVPAAKSTDKPATPPTPTPPADTQTGGEGGGKTTGGDTVTVTVTGVRPEIEHKADRDVYDVKQDPDAATGSASDVMNNIPAVTVDSDGTVSLRGDSSVQVYVNGKPSAQMQGDNRGPQLQNMSADDIDSIEVMTNPSAAFGADTGGGIINIVMKKGRHIKPITSINASLGNEGRGMFGFRSGTNIGKLTLNGNINIRSDSRKSGSQSDRTRIDPLTGISRRSTQNNISNSRNTNVSANLNGSYDLTDYDNLTGEINASHREQTGYSATESRNLDASGNVTSDNAQIGGNGGTSNTSGVKLTYDHRGKATAGEDFKIQLAHSQSAQDSARAYQQFYHQPPQAMALYATRTHARSSIDDFSGDWTHPLKNDQQIQSGWDIQRTISQSYNYRSLNHAEGTPELPSTQYTNQFNVDQTISAGYFTYQKKIGKLSFQGGMRVENLHEELNQVTSNIQATIDYTTWSPTVFALYQLSEENLVKASYSHKIVRPGAGLLNPFLRYQDAQNVSSGNPALNPEQVENYEIEYDHTNRVFNYSGTLFYKTTRDNFTNVSTFLPGQPDVLLTTSDNSGSRRDVGLQFSVNGNTSDRKLRYGANGVLGYSTQNSSDFLTHLPVRRESSNSNANMFLRYMPDTRSTYGLNVRYRSKTLTTQGYRTGSTVLNLSYQYQVIPNKLVINVNGRDVLSSDTSRTVTDTSNVQGVSYRPDYGATFMAGLRYTFGATRAPSDQNDRGQFRGQRGGGRGGGAGGGGGDGDGDGGGGGY